MEEEGRALKNLETKKPQRSVRIMVQYPWAGSEAYEVPETRHRMELHRALIHPGSGYVSDLSVWVSLSTAVMVTLSWLFLRRQWNH